MIQRGPRLPLNLRAELILCKTLLHSGTAFETIKEGVVEGSLVFITAAETNLEQVVIIYIP